MPRWSLALLPAILAAAAVAVPPIDPNAPVRPNPDAAQAAGKAKVEGDLTAEVWAAEPLLANPVAFAFDEQGRCFVAETTRFKHGVPDTRDHMQWLDEDLGARTVRDRVEMYKKHNYQGFEQYDDHLRLVWDSTGAGKADKSSVFAGGFTRPEDGLAAGVLARKGNVYFANIPDLYLLKDTKGTNVADVKQSLSTGYGVRAQFLGHDLHGLRMGPDGRLYFSIGDRGLNVTTKEGKKLVNTESGAVLRCDPDGANLEIVHTGLRNPQELAFDDFGNLFTFDNNCDSGDQARWVQIVPGGDSGWRCGYQYGTLMHPPGVPQGNRGPWNAEKIWVAPGKDGGPPAYVVPSLANFGNGPAGLTHYPGVGLNDKYRDHFFACDFTSNPGNSVIWTLAVKPKGASFEVVDRRPFVQNLVPTDCEFGPDGAFYWSDWVGGWSPPGKGRIMRVTDPEAMKHPAVGEAKKLLADGFEKRPVDELVKLLAHPHQQVRQEAQYELAGRKPDAVFQPLTAATLSPSDVTRRHALWALGMILRSRPARTVVLIDYLNSPNPDMRAEAARIVGTWGLEGLTAFHRKPVERLLADPDPRVRADAALAWARVARAEEPALVKPASDQVVYAPLFELLKANNDQDAYLRHAAVVALAELSPNPDDLFNGWKLAGEKYDVPAVRLGVVLALRKGQGRKLGEFLADADPRVQVEAVRAVYDEHISSALGAVAALADKPGQPDAIAYRALAAAFKLGRAEDATRLANFAARGEPDHLRAAAMKLLADWPKPPRRDPITGCVSETALAERPAQVAVEAVRPVLGKLFAGSDAVRKEGVALTAKLGIADVGPFLAGIVANDTLPAAARADALFALEAVKGKELAAVTAAALAAKEPRVRAAARVVKAKADPKTAATELPALLADESASAVEKQFALGVLGTLPESKAIDATLAAWLDKYLAGQVPVELKLDVLEAAQARATAKKLVLHAPLREKLAEVDKAARAGEKTDHLSRWRESLAGGDAEKGRQVFLTSAAVYCQRCHKLDGQGGDVGPELTGIGGKQPREYLLEAVVDPSKQIAKGYESVLLTLVDGRTVSGVLRAKTAKEFTVVTADNKVLTVPRDDVEAEKPDKSAMPDDLKQKLSKREVRDVVEFLATLKDPPKGKEGGR